MSHGSEINGVPLIGSTKIDDKTYCIDINYDVYEYDSETKKMTLITDDKTINKVLDYLEAKPLDIK